MFLRSAMILNLLYRQRTTTESICKNKSEIRRIIKEIDQEIIKPRLVFIYSANNSAFRLKLLGHALRCGDGRHAPRLHNAVMNRVCAREIHSPYFQLFKIHSKIQ